MSRINLIQTKIKELDGGSFQKLFDAYLIEKFNFDNIEPLGVQDGTNKTTKGTPDSFVKLPSGKFILIMYGTVESNPYKKLENDISSCLDRNSKYIDVDKVEKIICGYTSSNLSQKEIIKIENLIDSVQIMLIGIGTISYDLLIKYQNIAYEYLNVPIDTKQFYSPQNFIKTYDSCGYNAPLDINFMYRDNEYQSLTKSIEENLVTVVTGQSGVGKTKLVIEACNSFKNKTVYCIKNNGASLIEDISIYLSKDGEYILFIDDANDTLNFEYIISYIKNPPTNVKIHLIITLRDYVKEKIIEKIYKYEKPSIIQLSAFQDDEIKGISCR